VRAGSVFAQVTENAERSSDRSPGDRGWDGNQSQWSRRREQPPEAGLKALGHALAEFLQMMAAAGLVHLDTDKSGARDFHDALIAGERDLAIAGGGASTFDGLAIAGRQRELLAAGDVAQVAPSSLNNRIVYRGRVEWKCPSQCGRKNQKAKLREAGVFHSETRVRPRQPARRRACGTFARRHEPQNCFSSAMEESAMTRKTRVWQPAGSSRAVTISATTSVP
jgi:hypothetical protein